MDRFVAQQIYPSLGTKKLFVLSTGNRECEPSNFPKISVSLCPSNQVIWHMEEGAVRVTCYLGTLGKLPKS